MNLKLNQTWSGRPGTPIRLRLDQMELAMKLQDRIVENLARRHGERSQDYTGLDEPNKWFSGYCGEFCVYNWLDESGIEFTYNLNDDGTAQPSEFVIPEIGKVEVKTNSAPDGWSFHYPDKQTADWDLAIAVRLWPSQHGGSIMGIVGAGERHLLMRRKLKVWSMWMHYDVMRSPQQLIDVAMDRQRKRRANA